MSTYWMIAGMFLVTYGVRAGLWLGDSHRFPDSIRRALDYVPIAVLSAIVAPAVLLQHGALVTSWNNPQLAGALVTGVIVWRWHRLLLGIGAGLAVFVVWRWLL
ncbi:AzlD domain-containing protein [Chitiniphilus eburneus]|uniref:AzlD domain-containing protein n=1 Tax=Chitiniphilus eburneus TaxID=2571148 RepID=A0A4V5MQM2_9NEIS|nr:AzlD domain-containing protein [Chitiniphilus eburneus]TJZ73138.1 AzlD domain-containing protein [Chitiniphilus eburneus]